MIIILCDQYLNNGYCNWTNYLKENEVFEEVYR